MTAAPCFYCPEPAEHFCASCDRPVCGEHTTFSGEADERFCAPLRKTSARLWRDLFLCTPADRMPLGAVEMAKAEGWQPVTARQQLETARAAFLANPTNANLGALQKAEDSAAQVKEGTR
jgi:hypothetical protein